jgi:type I restriction enzyme S subunit
MSALEQEIPTGYLKTEYGIFPSDWSVLSLDDVCSFVGGAQPEKSVFSYKEQAGYIRLIQIRDYKSDKDIVYIPEKLARKKCSTADIMIGRYGPPIFQILRGIEGAYNVALIKATPKENIEREFLYYFLKNDSLFELMDMLSQRSSGQTGVELPALKSYPIGLPPKPEQTSIANALFDVDALLTELEKLIAKKQAIKTATMQQLLTGKTRLPQFATYTEGEKQSKPKGTKPSEIGEIPEDWDVVTLNDIAEKIMVGIASAATHAYRDRGIAFLRNQNILPNKLDEKDTLFISPEYEVAFQNKRLKTGDLLTARTGYPGTTCIVPEQFNGAQSFTTLITRLKKSISNPMYVSAYMNSEAGEKFFELNQIGGGQKNVNSAILKTLPLPFPCIKEQTAIATILSDMDNEIQTLEQRLAKTRQIKQGMMQELLTGRTRLPFDKD